MAYTVIALKDLAELKSRRGTSANTAMATILGSTFPLVEAYTVYVWDDTSLATPDDNQVVQPTIGGITTGRWLKVDFDVVPQVNADWNSSSGPAQILNRPTLFDGVYASLTGKPSLFSGSYTDLTNKPTIPTNNNQLTNGAGYITGYTETDPTVPSYAKSLTAFSVIKGSTDSLYKDINYVPSFTNITGKPTTLTGYGITDAVPSNRTINGLDLTTNRTLTSSDVSEGTRLYYTDTRARGSNSAGTGIGYDASTGIISNTAPDQTVTLTPGTGIGITGTYPNFTISETARSFNNNVARTLNSNYTISSTRDCIVNYSISLSCTNPLLAGSSAANAFLEYSTDGGTNWITVSNVTNSSSVALAVTIALTQPNTLMLSGIIPANTTVRIRTTTSGTASVTYTRGQEVYL